MIIFYYFKNFRSFLNEIHINMRALNYMEFPQFIREDNKNLIKTLAIYGDNASGKTNLCLAFACFHSLILEQLSFQKLIPQNYFISLLKLNNMERIIPFQLTDPNPNPTEMELTFISGQHVYEYGFTIRNQNIVTEHMTVDHHVVYTRTDREISIGRKYEKALLQKVGFRPHDKRLFCSILSCLDIPEISAIMKPFERFFAEHIAYYSDIFESSQFHGDLTVEERTYKILENPNALKYGLEQLQRFGIPVVDLIIKHGIPMLGYRVKSRTTGEYGTNYIDYAKVSSSTKKYLSLFIKIHHLFQNGGILIFDNVSKEIHPNVMKFIVDSFQQESNKKAQLIFTTYDSSILNNQQFNREEIAFVDINEYQESKIYTLADIMIRSNSNFSMDYLLKKYGTVPIIKDYIY
ncbi:MAG: ATP-binding protein [Lacrimispora celerecrescens]|nr:ATP-binding protein [Lacrimispora celerecrescens]